MRPGIFSDAGYRYRQNVFEKQDFWIPGISSSVEKFYDVTFFSSDSIIVGDDYMTIGEMYFRLKTDSITHARNVFSMMDWLGSIGGIRDILLEAIVIFFGGYIQFNATLQTFGRLCVPKDSTALEKQKTNITGSTHSHGSNDEC